MPGKDFLPAAPPNRSLFIAVQKGNRCIKRKRRFDPTFLLNL